MVGEIVGLEIAVQVAIAPDKSDIFITVNITEGAVYKLGEVKLGGNLIVPEAQLRALLLVQPGQRYSQKVISATQELIRNRLGAEGFYFAKVEPVPETDDAHRIVNLTLFVNPGSRTYVRHINFTGTTRSNDETLRRELRQLEGAWMSNIAVERSKQRLQRLPFIETVDMTTDPVAGAPDLVDVNFAVKERPSASVGGGIGYSAAQKFVLNANFSDSDFFGGGDQVTVAIDSGAYNKQYSLSQTDPYRNVDGLSRTLSMSYRDSTQFVSASSAFNSSSLELGVGYGYPISEFQGLSAGINVQSINLLTFAASSAQQAVQWVQNNGRSYRREAVTSYLEPDGSTITNSTALIGSRFNLYELTLGWAYDSRNRGLFADRGMRSALSLSVVPPGGDVRYWVGSYSFTGYWGLWRAFTVAESLQLAYGRGMSGTTGLPPYKRFYAGGPDTIRGYTEDTLGPVDSNGNPYGGNMLVVSRTELLMPVPQKWQTSARVSLFYDMGNVFSNDGTRFLGEDLQTPVNYGFSFSALRQSAGISVQWLAPALCIFRFSLGVPINKFAGNAIQFPDRTEVFQFSVGQSF